jgi:hypothetical protein
MNIAIKQLSNIVYTLEDLSKKIAFDVQTGFNHSHKSLS